MKRLSEVAVLTLLLSMSEAAPLRAATAPSAAPLVAAASEMPDVGVIAPKPPSQELLTGDNLFQFVADHGSTHYPSSVGAVSGGLLRWRGGRAETICVETAGLDRGYNAFISARLQAIAAFVGAPVDAHGGCKPNVHILFTASPREAMKSVLDRGAMMLGVKFPHQMEKELDVSGKHIVQAWYLTTGGGSSVLNRDPNLIGAIDLQGLWPRVIPTGYRDDGAERSIFGVFTVIDSNRIAGATVGSIADYIAMITLTMLQTPDHCDALRSVLDLMAPSCASRPAPVGLSAGDVAFLKALYYRNTGLGRTPSRDDIVADMTHQLTASAP